MLFNFTIGLSLIPKLVFKSSRDSSKRSLLLFSLYQCTVILTIIFCCILMDAESLNLKFCQTNKNTPIIEDNLYLTAATL